MRLLIVLPAVSLVLLGACGGGSTGFPDEDEGARNPPNAVAPLAPDYRAVFDCEARVQLSELPIPVALQGTYTLENEGEQIAYPGDGSRRGWKVRSTLELQVPAILRLQDPGIPASLTIVAREFIEVADDGSWYSLGAEIEDPLLDPPDTTRTWWASPMKLLEPTMAARQVITNPSTDVLDETFTDVLGTRASTRATAADTVVLDTPLGEIECFRSEVDETLSGVLPGSLPVDIRTERWEHPDMGLIRLEVEGLSYDGEYDGQPITIEIDRLSCLIRSLEP